MTELTLRLESSIFGSSSYLICLLPMDVVVLSVTIHHTIGIGMYNIYYYSYTSGPSGIMLQLVVGNSEGCALSFTSGFISCFVLSPCTKQFHSVFTFGSET